MGVSMDRVSSKWYVSRYHDRPVQISRIVLALTPYTLEMASLCLDIELFAVLGRLLKILMASCTVKTARALDVFNEFGRSDPALRDSHNPSDCASASFAVIT
mmetsp:Transcript_56659/g.118452  ORF Transcript_56659/g.118452 Transcript_56659/m.118452 type:complete len:102 (-) Transcript_56659:39-344(-)